MSSQVNEISVSSLFTAIKRSWLKLLLISLMIAIAAFFLLSSLSPRFMSEARVLVAPTATFQNPVAGRNPEAAVVDQASILSQIQVLLSRDIIGQVVDNYGLMDDVKFQKMVAAKAGNSISNILSHGWSPSFDTLSDETKRELGIDIIASNLQVVPLSESRVIGIRYHSADQIRTAGIANSLAKSYIEWQRSEKVLQNQDDSIRLSRLIADLKTEVEKSEAAVADYRAKKGIFKSSSTDVTLDRQQLTELNSRIIAARERRAETEIRAKLIREMLVQDGEVANTTETSRSQLLQRLFEQKNRTKRSMSELSATLLPSHPRIKQLNSELYGINQQIRAEMLRFVKSLENDAKIARAREESLVQSLDALKNQSTQTDGDEIQLRALEREARTNRDLLNSYLARFRDAKARKDSAIAPAYATIVSKAHVPSFPYFPQVIPMTLMAFFVTLLAGLGYVIIRAVLTGVPVAEQTTHYEPTHYQDHPQAYDQSHDQGYEQTYEGVERREGTL